MAEQGSYSTAGGPRETCRAAEEKEAAWADLPLHHVHVFNGQVFTLHVRAQKASRLTATSKEVLEMTDTRDVFEIRVRSCHHELQEMHMTVQGPGASPELSLTFALSQDLRHVHEEVCQHFDPLVPEWQSIVLTHGERVWLLRQGISPAVTLRQYCKDMLVPAAGARAESAANADSNARS